MPREILGSKNIHASIQKIVSEQHADIITEVKEAVAKKRDCYSGYGAKSRPKTST